MRRAAKIDDNQVAIVTALRQIGTDVLSLAAIGKGCPDLLCYRAPIGYTLLEIKDGDKSPSRRRLTEDQVRWHAHWRGPVHIVASVDEAIRAVTGQRL